MPRVLVTGANGFAGAAICRHLRAAIAEALGWSPAYTLDEGLALTVREAA